MFEYPIIGFAPDLPPDTPGVLIDSSGVLPTSRGISSGVAVSTAGSVFTGPSLGGARLLALDGATNRDFIGTGTKIYELIAGVPTDVAGTAYSATQIDTWSFAQFGAVSLAVNHANKLQASTSSGTAFADADSAAPKASIVITPGLPNAQFAMLFDYDDGTDAFGDGIFWSALSDYTDWTPDIATECGNVRITDLNGKFTAAVPYRDGVLAFKRGSMYLGTYLGGAAVWSWTRISSDVGCVGKNAVCVANDVVYFADEAGLWMFDGSYPKPMPGAVHEFWAAEMVRIAAGALSVSTNFVRLTWDRSRHLLWVGYGLATNQTTFLVFNVRSQVWTKYGNLTSTDGVTVVRELFNTGLAASNAAVSPGPAFPLEIDATAGELLCPANSFRLGAHGKTYGMTRFSSIRPQFAAGPSDTTAGWISGAVYYGPSVRNITAASIPLTFTAPGKLEGTIESRFIAPSLSFLASTVWECTKICIDVTYRTGE